MNARAPGGAGKVSRPSKRRPGVRAISSASPAASPGEPTPVLPRPGVAVDEHAELAARPARRPAEACKQRRVVDGNAHVCPAEQRGQPLELGLADDVVRHEDVVDPGVDHHLGFVQGLTRDAVCAERDLTPGDLDTLVRLHVRPVRQALPDRSGPAIA
jgi:hypothetical protein